MNRFVARVTDYDTGAGIVARRVTLLFTDPERPDIGASTLDLQATGEGTFEGQGANISLDGPWLVTAVIERQRTAVEVPAGPNSGFRISPRSTPAVPRRLPCRCPLAGSDPGISLTDARLTAGDWAFDVVVTTAGGETLRAHFSARL